MTDYVVWSDSNLIMVCVMGGILWEHVIAVVKWGISAQVFREMDEKAV